MAETEPTLTAAKRRPVLGLRRRPERLALAVFRLPLRAARSGHLPGRTFVSFTHVGRRTGRAYDTVAMVLRHDESNREVVVCAAWGPATDWVRNLRLAPAREVRLGAERYVPEHRFLSEDEALQVLSQFLWAHPVRIRLFRAVLGWDDLRDPEAARGFVATHPFVAFRPATRAA